MDCEIYLSFSGLNAPVRLDHAAELVPVLRAAIPSWPVDVLHAPPQTPPFASLRGRDDGSYEIDVHADPSAPRNWDAINVVCDLVAEMAWEKLRSQPDLLCVHGAAVQFGDRLVLFPNARRAGKSTLTSVLAHLGQVVFTDDFLSLDILDDGGIQGIANGIAPRLRLPVPDGFSDAFKRWTVADPGPSNRQYKYLIDAPLAHGGTRLPLGAVVILDRQDTPTHPRLDAIDQAAAMNNMIVQNFARSMHAGVILKTIETLVTHLPAYRLTYHSGEDAAAYLQGHPQLQNLPTAARANPEKPTQAPLEKLQNRPAPFDTGAAYVQRSGTSETFSDDAPFLADQSGLAIHQLNAGSAAIWRVLAEPTTHSEVVEILCVAFPDIYPEKITADSLATLQQLAAARLIEPAIVDRRQVAP